jgi:methionine synthase II (cobalamin-independent)
MSGNGDVLLVGSVPRESAEEVFRICSKALGHHLRALPDGEPGDRKSWIQCQAKLVFDGHRAIETVRRPNTPDGLARDYRDNWSFRLKSRDTAPEFDDLGYARWARDSYAVFAKLRQQGEIAADVRFQVSIPTPLGACVTYFEDPHDRETVYRAYEPALLREVTEICHSIPASDLAIQWDVCVEILEIAAQVSFLAGDPWQRAAAAFPKLGAGVPDGAILGYHLCYGDLGHKHFVEPQDLAVSVRMANLATTHSRRRVDWIHLPVPINRSDDAYFAPLRELASSDAQIFLGLIHLHDHVAGALGRAQSARRYLPRFGVATECGLGRRQPETLVRLLAIHRDVAERLESIES